MLRAWEELQPKEARAALQPGRRSNVRAALSSEIPGLAPLVVFGGMVSGGATGPF